MRLANTVLSPIAARLWPLDAELLKQSACRATGLRNFGDDVPLDVPLALLCRSLNEEVDLHPFGRLGIRHQIVGSLVNRLRLQDLVQRCPEAFAQPVRAPLVVVGPPRSGTTYLHRLMSCDPGLHTAPFWELWEPVPPPNWSNRPAAGDRRVARGRRAVAYMSWVVPAMRTMHELDNKAAEEETIVLTSAFSSILYEWNLGLPSYARWYRSADHTAGYRYLRRVLQAMQWARLRPARWALKAPQHLEQLRPLLRVFPDATVVQLHRDPVATVVSLARFVTYLARAYLDRPDPRGTGRRCADLVERLLRAADRDRDAADSRFVDVYFHQLREDPVGVLRRVYAAADLHLSPQALYRIRAWLPEQRRVQHGVRRYRPEDFDLTVSELHQMFAFYYRRHPSVQSKT
jgi:Sulfotransferase family